MFSPTTIRPPGRFLRFRYLLPAIVFLVVVRLSLSGDAGRGTIARWGGFLRHENKAWSETDRTKVPDGGLKAPLDHDRKIPNQEPIKGDEGARKGKYEPPNHGLQEAGQDQELVDKVCGGLRSGKRIVITVNTGATEILERVPTILKTSLLCAPNVYLYSDLAHKLGDRQVYDCLDTVPADVMDGNPDFDIYRKQLELKDPVRIAEFLKGMKDPRNSGTVAAWTLDKYKKLHILEKVWDLHPDMDWYLHVDADTYVIWSTLVEWLAKLDPTRESYLGSVAYINNLPFGHGGSGMLLSGAAMRNYAVQHNGTAGIWDYKMQNECCSDFVLAQVLKEYGIEVINSWPTIQGEPQSSIPFDGTHWCGSVATMHHVSPLEAAQMGVFESQRKDKTKPLTFEELFNGLVSDLIPQNLDDWDNMAQGHTADDVHSYADCVDACKKESNCLQAQWKGEECVLGTDDVKLGVKHVERDENNRWKSVWMKKRIREWAERQNCHGKLKFPFEDGKTP